VWIGLAGHDRKQVADAVDQALEALFKRPRGSGLTITNDIELLAIPAAEKQNADSILVLVAGTGSVAMSFKRAGEKFTRVGRSGGWGHLLGDNGSGFDIGRQGIRMALAALDRFNNRERGSDKDLACRPVSHAERLILDRFLPEAVDAQNFDLLSAVLSGSSELEKKKRIAEVARLVLEASKSDPEAEKIVDRAVQDLIRLVDPFTESGQINPQTSILVLGGGLVQDAYFSGAVRDALGERETNFKHIEVVSQPAVSGAMYLLCEQQD
jgi:N-acetylmuramic acid 6-phosphate etherase